jgi:hypothetical protein
MQPTHWSEILFSLLFLRRWPGIYCIVDWKSNIKRFPTVCITLDCDSHERVQSRWDGRKYPLCDQQQDRVQHQQPQFINFVDVVVCRHIVGSLWSKRGIGLPGGVATYHMISLSNPLTQWFTDSTQYCLPPLNHKGLILWTLFPC